jgi:asparagine synthase (glutamine-hydrolysing)
MLRGQSIYGSHLAQRDQGAFSSGRKLHATVPEDRFDKEPCARADFQLVADIRLDNRSELIAALTIDHERGAHMSDTALLFECLLAWRESAVERLVGDFAFAFWNGADCSLILARDLFGHRPLFFHQADRFFAFSSMPSGLHALPDVPREFDREMMSEHLALLPYGGARTHFRAIQRVQPAHLVRVTKRGVTPTQYWHPPEPHARARSASDYEEGLRSVLDEAVRSQLRGASMTVGCQLSSGLDSSIVTTSAASAFAPGKVLALTAVPRSGFSGPVPPGTIADEGDLARRTAEMYPNIEHIRVETSEESLLSVIERQHHFMQQPTMTPCNAAWGRDINRVAAERGVKVLLVGFSGNMTISYSGLEWWASLVPRGKLITALRMFGALAASGISKRSLAAQMLGPILPQPLWKLACRLYGRPIELDDYTALNPGRLGEVRDKAKREHFDLYYRPSQDPLASRLGALFDADNGSWFKGVLAEFGISTRDPTSDRRVVEYCLSVPPREYILGGVARGLARRAFAHRLPRAVAQMQARGFQAAGWYEAVARDLPLLREELDRIRRSDAATDIVDPTWIQEAVDSWPAGSWDRRGVVLKYRYGLLRGLSAGHFMRAVAGTN